MKNKGGREKRARAPQPRVHGQEWGLGYKPSKKTMQSPSKKVLRRTMGKGGGDSKKKKRKQGEIKDKEACVKPW